MTTTIPLSALSAEIARRRAKLGQAYHHGKGLLVGQNKGNLGAVIGFIAHRRQLNADGPHGQPKSAA